MISIEAATKEVGPGLGGIMKFLFSCFSLVTAMTSLLRGEVTEYDPLPVSDGGIISKTFEASASAGERMLPLRVYLPNDKKPAPVVLFSHGLGGSRDNNPYLGNHWAKRGYVVVFIQHPGSDENVWKATSPPQRMSALRQAASAQNLILRAKDVSSVIDALTSWNAEKNHALQDRLDLKKIGMSGHSFGAVTTQAVAGQKMGRGGSPFLESRISAAVMMSPSSPVFGEPAMAFGSIKIPCLLMTGTLDTSPVGNASAEDRLKVFPCLKLAPAWQVVFDKATHMSFGDHDLKGNPGEGNRYHKAILAITTAFWDAELRGDKQAKGWLNGIGVKSLLAPEDTWEMNLKATE